jgi:hypothetical protein
MSDPGVSGKSAGGGRGLNGFEATPTSRRPGGRLSIALSLAAGAASGLVIATIVFALWGFGPHTSCRDEGQLTVSEGGLPAVLVNSPYRGSASGEGILAADFPGGPGYPTSRGSYGVPAANGTASGAFFSVNLSVHAEANVSRWSAGPSSFCTNSFEIVPQPSPISSSLPWQIPVQSNLTDRGESVTVNLSGYLTGSPVIPSWNNGFTFSNHPNVTTCGRPGFSLNVTSHYLMVGVPALVYGVETIVPFSLPFTDVYQYSFPTNGTWAVDNLSAPGGPGGGWAFDYLGACT